MMLTYFDAESSKHA